MPVITTSSKNGEFDPARMKNIVKFAEKGGIKGFFVGRTYGTSPPIELRGKKTVVETLRNSVSFSADIIVNVGSSSPVESIKLAKYTESVGAVAIASVHLFIILVDKATIEKIARSLDRVLWRAKHVD